MYIMENLDSIKKIKVIKMKTLKDIEFPDCNAVSTEELRELAREQIKVMEEYLQPDIAKIKTSWIKWFFNL